MKLLGIDTSTSYAGVDLYIDGTHATRSWYSRHNHGRELMHEVSVLLDAAGIAPSELDAIAVAVGPGGFSSVRVGIATAQGLALPTHIPLIGVPTHLIAAAAVKDSGGKSIVSLIGVGRNHVSYGVYQAPVLSLEDEIETGICEADEVEQRFTSDEYVRGGEWVQEMEYSDLPSNPDVVRPPQDMIEIALHWIRNDMVPNRPIEPIYARPPTITPPRSR